MRPAIAIALLALLATGAAAQTAPNPRRPYIGYLCAAGGQRGTTVRVTVGGQNLRGARTVLVSGEGVRAKVVQFRRPAWLLSTDERRVVAQALRRAMNRKLNPRPAGNRDRNRNRKAKAENRKKKQAESRARKDGQEQKPVALPDHPMLKDLESLTPKELRRVMYEFLDRGRRAQLSPQIAETVEIEVEIDAEAEPGDRELRIRTNAGLTNPVLFQVGTIPERSEREPNDYRTRWQETADTPCVFNGQVSFKDIDRFRFRAKAGQKLVIEAQARRLVPYLADAVPGWFQATLSLHDAKGNELAYVDDHRFDPDPVLLFDVPADGDYVVEIKDAIYRGREDFVYRVTVAERPFVLSMFPLGARRGVSATASLQGWNLAWKRVRLNTKGAAEGVRHTTWSRNKLHTNPVFYAVDKLPESTEKEPNGLRVEAQRIPFGRIMNGRIDRPGDMDRFSFYGRRGQEVVAEVYARRLGSPLDSLLQITNEEGAVIAWNDDHEDKTAGLVTHQADSYVRTRLPGNGTYTLRVSDTQNHGGDAFAYRLRLDKPRPDFTVIVTPASVNIPAGGHATVTAHVVRRDGFSGAVDLSIPDATRGLQLHGGRIPANCDRVRMTLSAPPQRRAPPTPLSIVARAAIGGRAVKRAAVPAEDMMQAFGLHHLVPAQSLLVDVKWSWRRALPVRSVAAGRTTRIALGRTAEIRFAGPGLPELDKVRFELDNPPAGLSIRDVRDDRGEIVLLLGAEFGKAQPALKTNLIVKAHVEFTPPRRGKQKQPPRKVVLLAIMPAIPIEIVADM